MNLEKHGDANRELNPEKATRVVHEGEGSPINEKNNNKRGGGREKKKRLARAHPDPSY